MQMHHPPVLHRRQFGCTHLSLSQILGGVSVAHISTKASGDAQQVTLGVILVVSHPPAGQACRPLIPQPGSRTVILRDQCFMVALQ